MFYTDPHHSTRDKIQNISEFLPQASGECEKQVLNVSTFKSLSLVLHPHCSSSHGINSKFPRKGCHIERRQNSLSAMRAQVNHIRDPHTGTMPSLLRTWHSSCSDTQIHTEKGDSQGLFPRAGNTIPHRRLWALPTCLSRIPASKTKPFHQRR